MTRHSQHGCRIDEVGGGLVIRDVIGNRPGLPRGNDSVFSPVASLGVDRDDPLSLDESTDQARADFVDDSDAFEARSRRQRGQNTITAFDDHHVRRIHRALDHSDADFAGARMRVRDLSNLQDLSGIAEFLEDSSFHEFPISGGGGHGSRASSTWRTAGRVANLNEPSASPKPPETHS